MVAGDAGSELKPVEGAADSRPGPQGVGVGVGAGAGAGEVAGAGVGAESLRLVNSGSVVASPEHSAAEMVEERESKASVKHVALYIAVVGYQQDAARISPLNTSSKQRPRSGPR
jgi:hypothetical protein